MSRFIRFLATAWRSTPALIAVILIVVAFVVGWSLGDRRSAPAPGGPAPVATATEYTCSMHPQVRLPDPNAKCPICFMDLIPVGADASEEQGERVMSMTPAAMKLAEIRTTPVVRRLPVLTVRLYGDIDYDETRVATIAAYFPGRLERLYVDFIGIPVREGDHLVSIYSPELVTAEAELVTMRRNLDRLQENASEDTLRSFRATVEGSREKLRLWGLTPEQIANIEETGETPDHLTIYSPMGGVVLEKHKVKGDYVQTGEPIFSVADLSHLWLRLDAYESDMRWLRHGQEVEFTTGAHPGESFFGRVSFIDPQISPVTRTARLRVNVDNRDGRLKPGMFVRAEVRPVIGGAGEVLTDDLTGRWVCPMHPEVVEPEQTPCRLCGMDLVPAEELGYVAVRSGAPPPLMIPSTAPLITGRRAVVYVQLPGREQPTYEGREIVLGPRAGDHYIVREDGPHGAGLAEGDLVVVNGAFKIDSALQIAAKPSMMDARGDDAARARLAGQFDGVYAGYFAAQEGLAGDDLAAFTKGVAAMHEAVRAVDEASIPVRLARTWAPLRARLLMGAADAEQLDDLEAARALFETYARAAIELEEGVGHVGDETHYVTFCPMAFDNRGAPWLARVRDVNNPYFGASMLRCGSVKAEMPPLVGAGGGAP